MPESPNLFSFYCFDSNSRKYEIASAATFAELILNAFIVAANLVLSKI